MVVISFLHLAFVLYFSSFYLVHTVNHATMVNHDMILYARVWKKTIDIFTFFGTFLCEGG